MRKKSCVLFFIIFMTLLIGCSTKTDINNKNYQNEFKIETYQPKESPQVEINYPVFKSDEINNKIIEFRNQAINDFSRLIDNKNDHNRLLINIYPHKINENNFVFNITERIKLDKKDAFVRHHTFVVNVETNNIGMADTLFDLTKDNDTQLFEKLNRATLENDSIAPYYQPEKLKKYIKNHKNYFNNFSIKDNFIQFHFKDGEIGLPAMGTPTIELKILDVSDLFNDSLKATTRGQDSHVVEEKVLEGQDEKQEIKPLSADDKMVALTFDDGPKEGTTEQVLDILDEYEVKATFFMLGQSIEEFPKLATEVDKRGHEIGNHSYSHTDMLTLSIAGVQQEINSTTTLIEKYTNQTPKLFRPPYGSFNNHYDVNIALDTVYWSVDTEDWLNHNPDLILEKIEQYTTDGSVILMHDIHTETVDSLKRVIQYLQSQDFKLVTLSELQRYKGNYVSEMR